MKQVYCDNGSTSFPKAPGLGEAIADYITKNSVNISRGSYGQAFELEEEIMNIRYKLCDFFKYDNPKNVIFTSGATMSINMIVNGILNKGDKVITSSVEHNAVVRPLTELAGRGIRWECCDNDEYGQIDLETMARLIEKSPKLVLVTHASNVCGTVLPIEAIGKMCKDKGVLFAVDASQSAGLIPIDMEKSGIDGLAFPGHKSMLGPQGIGGLILSEQLAKAMRPIIHGGTGSFSDVERMPENMPDKFQPGTQNIPGIIGLGHSLDFLMEQGAENILKREKALVQEFLDELKGVDGVKVIGYLNTENRCAVVSLDFVNMDNAEAAYDLEAKYGIMTRCGLHCAPHAHKTLGTYPKGTVRFTFGYFNTEEEIKYIADSVKEIAV